MVSTNIADQDHHKYVADVDAVSHPRLLLLFDLDGTLSLSQRPVHKFFPAFFRYCAWGHADDLEKALDEFPVDRANNIISLIDTGEDTENPRNKLRLQLQAVVNGNGLETGIVTGSDEKKVRDQFQMETIEDLLGVTNDSSSPSLKYLFFENGTTAYERSSTPALDKDVDSAAAAIAGASNMESDDQCVHPLRRESLRDYLGEDAMDRLLRLFQAEMDKLDLFWSFDVKVEERTGNVNVSPIGRRCTLQAREEFAAWDKEHGLRKKLQVEFLDLFRSKGGIFATLAVELGGDISLDIAPSNWNKEYVVREALRDRLADFTEIHFFGDRCYPGGNDYSLYSSPLITHGHEVAGPEDTCLALVNALLSFHQAPHTHHIHHTDAKNQLLSK